MACGGTNVGRVLSVMTAWVCGFGEDGISFRVSEMPPSRLVSVKVGSVIKVLAILKGWGGRGISSSGSWVSS